MTEISSTAARSRHHPETIELSYESTVSRHFVHRAAVAEVLLTDWKNAGDDAFVCAAQWPRSHTLQRSNSQSFDPLLIAETIRQCGILLTHVGYGVPLDTSFLMRRLLFSCVPERLRATGGPLDLVVEISVRDLQRRGRRVGGMRIDAVLRSGDASIAEGSGWLRCIDRTAYDRLRRGTLPDGPGRPCPAAGPMPPASVGRDSTDTVVIGAGDRELGYSLRVPIDHPVFFDHALDHVPGMLAIEALRQAGVAAIGRPEAVLVSSDAQFDGFLEFDRECVVLPRVVTEEGGRWDVLVDIEQDGIRAVRGSVLLAA